MADCAQLAEFYEAYALGALDGDDLVALEEHLARHCPTCTAGVAQARMGGRKSELPRAACRASRGFAAEGAGRYRYGGQDRTDSVHCNGGGRDQRARQESCRASGGPTRGRGSPHGLGLPPPCWLFFPVIPPGRCGNSQKKWRCSSGRACKNARRHRRSIPNGIATCRRSI